MLEFNTPIPGSHTGEKVHRTDGATTKFGKGSPASSGGYSHYTTSFNASRSGSHADIFPQRPRLRSPYYTRMLPDWDSRQVIPKPIDTLLARLTRVSKLDEKSKTDMKPVMNLYKHFKGKYAGNNTVSWTKHIDSLETEVFEAQSLVPKQCYYVIRKTLTGPALKAHRTDDATAGN